MLHTATDDDEPRTEADGGPRIMFIKGSSSPQRVAGAIVGELRQANVFRIRAIGAAAINQAVKGIAIARQICQEEEINGWADLAVLPAFETVLIAGDGRTAITFDCVQSSLNI